MHGDYVDCVRWLGDLVMSKSVHDVIALWRPEGQIINRRPPPGASGWAAAAAAAASDDGRGGEGGGDEGSDRGAGLSVSGTLGGESVSNHATKILVRVLYMGIRRNVTARQLPYHVPIVITNA